MSQAGVRKPVGAVDATGAEPSDIARRSPCAYPWQQMIVDLTGEVVPCCFWSGYGNSGKPLGNTNEESLQEIWNGEAYRDLRRRNASGDLAGHPCGACMAYRWAGGEYPRFSWPSSIAPESGFCATAPVPESMQSSREPVLLLQDGEPLPIADAIHDDIRARGMGRYSVWGETLYFSTSDNSDPVTNGRVYELRSGDERVVLGGLVRDSRSGRNLLRAHDEYRRGAEVVDSKPSMISFISTADCNIDCPACSQNLVRLLEVQHRPETELEVLALVPYLQQLIWHGGEPYLIRRFREFIDGFETHTNPNLAFGFTSNGTMLNTEELDKLEKFPRINASISVDSFVVETFERIRAGASYDRVLRNLLAAMERYRTGERVFSVGMIIAKSNFHELAENLRFAVEHDIGMNLSPVVVVPVHERIDVFEDFAAQTAGWRAALAEARDIVRKAKSEGRRAIRRIDPEGMLDVLGEILADAEARYARVFPLELEVSDPHQSLPEMKNPGLIFAPSDAPERPLAYTALAGAGPTTVRLPLDSLAGARRINWSLVHDLDESMGILDFDYLCDSRQRPLHSAGWREAPGLLRLEIPAFRPPPRARRNILVANQGLPTAQGVHSRGTPALEEVYRARVDEETAAGFGLGPAGGRDAIASRADRLRATRYDRFRPLS